MKKIVLSLIVFLVCTSLFATSPKQIIFFGDSLTDNGNMYKHSMKIIPKSPPYFEGRFTNGLTWAEYVGLNYSLKYQIYAVGGATAVFHRPTTKFVAPTTLTLEIYKYIFDSLMQDRSQNLYVIWIGDNDYMFYQDMDPDSGTTSVLDGVISGIKTLAGYGAKHFLILNLTDSAKTPFILKNGDGQTLHNLVMIHNNKLAFAIEQLKVENTGIRIDLMDAYHFFDDVYNQPEKYNELYNLHLKDVRNACWQGGLTLSAIQVSPSEFESNSLELNYTYHLGKSFAQGNVPCENANEHLYWDDIHPSAITHYLIARAATSLIDQNQLLN